LAIFSEVGYCIARVDQGLVVELNIVQGDTQNSIAFWNNLLKNWIPTR